MSREAKLAVVRCIEALDDDYMPLHLQVGSTAEAQAARYLCDEAITQLSVEPSSDLVDTMKEQIDEANVGIGVGIAGAMVDGAITAQQAEDVTLVLGDYASKIQRLLDEA